MDIFDLIFAIVCAIIGTAFAVYFILEPIFKYKDDNFFKSLTKSEKFRYPLVTSRGGFRMVFIIGSVFTAIFSTLVIDWWFSIIIFLLYWFIMLKFGHPIVALIVTLIIWVGGFICGFLGIKGGEMVVCWMPYCFCFVDSLYCLICDLLDYIEIKKGKTPLETRCEEWCK